MSRKLANLAVNIDTTISKHDEKLLLFFMKYFNCAGVNDMDLFSFNNWSICFSDCLLSKRVTGKVAVMDRGV